MRSALRALVVLVALTSAAVLAPTPAFADSHAPALTSAELSSATALSPGAPIEISWAAEDQVETGSGVRSVEFDYEDLDGSGAQIGLAYAVGNFLPLSDGRSVALGALSPWAAEGHYRLDRASVSDDIGNYTQYLRDGTVSTYPPGIAASPPAPFDFAALDFDVKNPLADTATPTVTDLSLVTPTVHAGEPVIVTSTARDDRSGVSNLAIRYVSPSGTTPLAVTADVGLATAGLMSGVLPLGAEGGTWRAAEVDVRDRAGNDVSYYRNGNGSFRPTGVRPFQQQPPVDFAALDVQVVPLLPDAEAPTLSDMMREGPAELHRGDDVVMHFAAHDASALDWVRFDFQDATGHNFTVSTHCHPERGIGVARLPDGLDPGRVRLQDVDVADELFNVRQYWRDGTVRTQGHDQPDAEPGIDLSAFDFDIVEGAPAYTGHLATEAGCPNLAQLPLSLPESAQPGDVIPISGQVLTGASDPIPSAPVAVFDQPAGQDPQLLGISSADDAGKYARTAVVNSETAFVVRFLGRDGAAGAEATTSERRIVRMSGSASGTPTPAPSSGSTSPPATAPAAVAPTLTAATSAVYGSALRIGAHGAPGAPLELWAYSRPSTTYRLVRSSSLDSDGSWSTTVRPSTNTRLFVRTLSGTGWLSSPTRAVQIQSAVTLRVSAATSMGRRTLTGTAGPALAGRLISIYRTDTSGPQLIARVRTTSSGGYTLTATIPRGRAVFDARTAATDRNAAGVSRGVATS